MSVLAAARLATVPPHALSLAGPAATCFSSVREEDGRKKEENGKKKEMDEKRDSNSTVPIS